MSMVEFAREELTRAGTFKEDPEFAESIVKAIEGFVSYGHSGGSAGVGIAMLHQLLQHKPLSPLTGEDDEWVVLDYDDRMYAQNRRFSSVFKRRDGSAYWGEGRVFREPDGSTYVGIDSDVEIAFPWMPTEPEVVDRPFSESA